MARNMRGTRPARHGRLKRHTPSVRVPEGVSWRAPDDWRRLAAEEETGEDGNDVDGVDDETEDADRDGSVDDYEYEGVEEIDQEIDETEPSTQQDVEHPARSFQFVPPPINPRTTRVLVGDGAGGTGGPVIPGDEPFDFSRVQVQHVAQPSPHAATTLRTPTFNDIDRLWDWCRTDRDAVQSFFGWMPQRSIDLQHAIANLQQHEANGLAWFRSIDGPPLGQSRITHHGFVSLFPIDRQGPHPVGAVHIYLAPEARGLVQQYLPYLLAAADRDLPGVGLTIFADRTEWARLLVPLGFRAQVLLTRMPRNGSNGHGGQGG